MHLNILWGCFILGGFCWFGFGPAGEAQTKPVAAETPHGAEGKEICGWAAEDAQQVPSGISDVCSDTITHNYHLYNLYYYEKDPEVKQSSRSQTKLQFVYQVLSVLGVIRSLICSAWPRLWKRTLLTSLTSSLRRLPPRSPVAARRDATRPPRSGRAFTAPSLSLRHVSSSLSALPPPEDAWLGNDVISKSDICLARKHTSGYPDP